MTATDAFLARQTPVTDALRPLAAGDADWPATKASLEAVEWTDVPQGTPDQLMGRDGGEFVADLEPGAAPVEGSWREVLAARDLGILSAEQTAELLEAVVGKAPTGG